MVPAGAGRRRAAGTPESRLRQRVGIASAAALLLGSVPLLRALQPPASTTAGLPTLAGPTLGGVSTGGGEFPTFNPDAAEGASPGGPSAGGDPGGMPASMTGALERMTREVADRPRVYVLLEDAPTDTAVAMLLTAAGVRFRIEDGVRGRVTLRPVHGPGVAPETLLHICRDNTGPRLDVAFEGDTYVVRASDSGPTAAPAGAAAA